MQGKSTFESKAAYKAYLDGGKAYFKEKYNLGNAYHNPRSSPGMLIHLYEQAERTNALLENILEKISLPEKTS